MSITCIKDIQEQNVLFTFLNKLFYNMAEVNMMTYRELYFRLFGAVEDAVYAYPGDAAAAPGPPGRRGDPYGPGYPAGHKRINADSPSIPRFATVPAVLPSRFTATPSGRRMPSGGRHLRLGISPTAKSLFHSEPPASRHSFTPLRATANTNQKMLMTRG